MDILLKSANKGDDFVGIKFINNEPCAYFPIGYLKEDKIISNKDYQAINEIKKLISIIKYKNKKEGEIDHNTNNEEKNNFPIDSYIEVINYFINNGYYIEKEIRLRKDVDGNINWVKTIGNIKPYVQEHKGLYSPVYSEFIIKDNKVNDNNLLTKIHKYCVNLAFSKIGFLYSFSFNVNYRLLELETNKQFINLAIKTVKNKIRNTNNDKIKRLFTNLLLILQDIDYNNRDFHNLSYGTNSFENIWEKLIDNIFGISNKKEYNPKTTWGDIENEDKDNKNSLVIDTIMFDDENKEIFVVDAKYYKVNGLPQSSDINKQITYGDRVYKYLEENKNKFNGNKVNKNNIYNAFILPENIPNEEIKYYKTATSNWRPFKGEENKKHLKIQAIYFDTKTLINLVNASKKEQLEYKQRLIGVIKQN